MDSILTILKIDLQISNDKLDGYLNTLISSAKKYIETEGIVLDEKNVSDNNLVAMYAAYMYRSRKKDIPMPRMLRWALNNRLFSQKAGE